MERCDLPTEPDGHVPSVPLSPEEVRGWMPATCAACGRLFGQEAPFKTLCIPCFKATRGIRPSPVDAAHLWLQLTLEGLRKELVDLQTQMADTQRANTELKRRLATVEPPLSDAPLRDLIFFAHPDRNGGSEKATAATKALNAIRERRAR